MAFTEPWEDDPWWFDQDQAEDTGWWDAVEEQDRRAEAEDGDSDR
jgi:hypothetical protein